MSDRKPSPILPVAVTLTVLLGLYVGAYYWLVEPSSIPYGTSIDRVYWVGKVKIGRRMEDEYRTNQTLDLFFAPIHWLDRRIRPDIWELRPAAELRSALALLGTDHIDILTLYYIERREEWEEITAPGGALRYLQAAKRDGTVRQIGITSHQGTLAAEMARSGLLDALMIRYNAAHRGAERDVFPVTQPLGLPVITYTALRWGALLQSTPEDPTGFSVLRAPDWYRFVLQHPAVALTLCAPQTRAELDEDLRVLDADGPLTTEEYATLAEHGERVRRHAGSFR